MECISVRCQMEQRALQSCQLKVSHILCGCAVFYICEKTFNRHIFLLTGTIVRKLPRKLEVLEGENAVFCVEVENDDMEIHWFKDGLKLHETHQTILKSFGKTHILVFVNVAYHDSGVVTFVAGRSKTSSRLKVKGIFGETLMCVFVDTL